LLFLGLAVWKYLLFFLLLWLVLLAYVAWGYGLCFRGLHDLLGVCALTRSLCSGGLLEYSRGACANLSSIYLLLFFLFIFFIEGQLKTENPQKA